VINQPNYVEAKNITIFMVAKKTNQEIVTVKSATIPYMQTANEII
jgi:hypothetical protein